MEALEELKVKRAEYRKKIEEQWKVGKPGTLEDYETLSFLNKTHQEILEIESTMPDVPKTRVGYAVCGWSEKHGYFRNKFSVHETLEEAKSDFEILKNDPNWRIATLIVECTSFRDKSPAMSDFDTQEIHHATSDSQEVIEQHKMGMTGHTWEYMLSLCHGRYTY